MTALLAGARLCSPFLHAAVLPTFTAGTETVDPGGSVSVPITVQNFQNVDGVQFSLTWNSGLLTLQPTPVGGLIPSLSGGTFGPGTGALTWAWFNIAGVTVVDGTAIFSVQFTASGTPGETTVSFGDTPTPRLAVLLDGTFGVPFTVNGNVTVVPEPINWALGLFACVFIGGAASVSILSRMMARIPPRCNSAP